MAASIDGFRISPRNETPFLTKIGNGVWGLGEAVGDAANSAAVYGLATVALDAIQQSAFAWATLGLAAGVGGVTLIVNVVHLISATALQNFNKSILEFYDNYPYVKIIGVLFSLAVCPFNTYAGLAIGFVTGVTNSLALKAQLAEDRRKLEMMSSSRA